MKKVVKTNEEVKIKRPPARTPEAREKQLTALAYDLVEKRLLDGTATSQETVHFLKLGNRKSILEEKRQEAELELIRAKTEALNRSDRIEELYSGALAAMRKYSSGLVRDEEDE